MMLKLDSTHCLQIDPDLGEIIIPFLPSSSQRTIVMGDPNGVADCASVLLKNEVYKLSATVLINPESIVPHQLVPLMIRADLRVCGETAPMAVMEDVKLEIVSRDAEGVGHAQLC